MASGFRAFRGRKVKRLGGEEKQKWEMKFETAAGDELDGKFTDEARAELTECLDGCLEPALDLLELPENYGLTCTVKGVTVTWSEDVMGAVVTISKKLIDAPSPTTFNTPHLPVTPYGGPGAGGDVLPDDLAAAVERVEREICKYINGERAQMSLFPSVETVPIQHDEDIGERDVPADSTLESEVQDAFETEGVLS